MTKEKILTWKCKTCGKELSSIYPKQLEFNKETHLRSHDKGAKE